MRRDTTKPLAGFAARLPRPHKDTFEGRLPIKGAKTFFVETALTQFLDLAENSPAIQNWVREEIQRMLHEEEKPRGVKETTVYIATPLYERFQRVFPEYGATTWFFRQAVKAFVEDSAESIEEQIHRAVLRMLEAHVTP